MPSVFLSRPPRIVPAAKDTLRVLTLNCCLLPTFIYQSNGSDNREQRAVLIKKMVQRYDIVLLQEVLGSPWCSQWREMFKELPHHQTVMTIRGHHKLIDSGLVILSRYPIVKCAFRRFQSKSATNSIIDRGFLYARVIVGTKEVNIINTHLNPSECNLGFHTAEEYRRRQLDEILEFKNKLAAINSGAWVIGGDFNSASVIMRMPTTMAISLIHNQPPTCHNLVPFALPGDKLECIDYIVTSTGQTYAKRNENLVSDHYGVEVGMIL